MTSGPLDNAPRPFGTVLVANRGEIAVRVLQAARAVSYTHLTLPTNREV
mgnify:CR=1 FL=1